MFEQYCLDCLRIANKDGQLVPLRLNYTQRKIIEAIAECRARGVPPRIIILKSRQVGVSTMAEALIFHACHLNDNRSGLVLAHTTKAARGLFRMTKRFLVSLPDDLRPKRKLDNVHEIHFAENDSRLEVEAEGEVRGYTAQYVHLSELAFMQQDRETFRAIMQTVPNTTDSLAIIESTANGVGNKFHELWKNSMRKWGDSQLPPEERGWVPIFIPWYRHEEYIRRPWFTPDQTTGQERSLARTYSLNMRQLAWRRWCIETNCDGDQELFNVEYPATPSDAFLLSGRPVFDADARRYYGSLVPPNVEPATLPPTCEISFDDATRAPIIIPIERGRLRIYEPPVERHTYIVGADPSEGDPGSDYSPLAVLDQMTLNFVSVWHGRCPPDLLAQYAVWLAIYYNQGLVINEANNHGISFHNAVIAMGYPNLFYRKVNEDSVALETTLKPGLLSTNRLKHSIFNTFRKYAREKVKLHKSDSTRIIRDPVMVGEMETLIYRDARAGTGAERRNPSAAGSVRIEAQRGYFDDLATCGALCLYAHRGDDRAPLEPIPIADLRSALGEVLRVRERDPERANRIAIDVTGMTCEELQRRDEEEGRREMKQRRFGLGAMH